MWDCHCRVMHGCSPLSPPGLQRKLQEREAQLQAVMAKSPDRWLRAAAAQGLSLREAAVFTSPGKSARPHYHPSPTVDRQQAGQPPQRQHSDMALAAMDTPGRSTFDCFAAGEAGVEPYSARLHTAERSLPRVGTAAVAAAPTAAGGPVLVAPLAVHDMAGVGSSAGGKVDLDLAAGSNEYMEVRPAGRLACSRGQGMHCCTEARLVCRAQARLMGVLCLQFIALVCEVLCASWSRLLRPPGRPGLQMLRRLEQGLKVDRQQLEPFTHPAPPPLPEHLFAATAADARADATQRGRSADGAVTVRARQASNLSNAMWDARSLCILGSSVSEPPASSYMHVASCLTGQADCAGHCAGGVSDQQQASQRQDRRVQPAGRPGGRALAGRGVSWCVLLTTPAVKLTWAAPARVAPCRDRKDCLGVPLQNLCGPLNRVPQHALASLLAHLPLLTANLPA